MRSSLFRFKRDVTLRREKGRSDSER